MSKLFSCIFPFAKSAVKPTTDLSNEAFVIPTDKNTSVCNLSYHHVDDVSKKALQKKIEKLEAEKEALVEMMIYQHEDFKRRNHQSEKPDKLILDSEMMKTLEKKKTKKTSSKKTSSNYYSTVKFRKSIGKLPKQCIDAHNQYDTVEEEESNIYMTID